MNRFIVLFLLLAFSASAFGETAVTIPYEEFKQLYGDRIRREIQDKVKPAPFLHAINSARYEMTIGPSGALCRTVLSGSLISGRPQAIPLFSDKIIIREIHEVAGGALVSGGEGRSISFFPSGEPSFSLSLTFFIPASEDNNSAYIALDIPAALENALLPDTGKETVLLDVPGIETRAGTYHFSTRSDLKIRYSHGAAAAAKTAEKQADLSRSYQAVSTPTVVLEAVSCFTTFEENGNILSVIAATIPPEAGATFAIRAQSGAEIWQCRINGKKVKVYKSPEGNWVLPLARDRASRVELALLSQGDKVGLQGKLEMTLPWMALPARRVNIALGLPERVDLVSFQGPVSSAGAFTQQPPEEFSGTPYYFSRSFHKGQPITLSISYKEPAKKG